MTTHIALLRGINVGGKNILPMKALVGLLEKNGYEGVKTYLQTGNLIFESSGASADRKASTNKEVLADDIGLLIEKEFGFRPEILVVRKTEFHAAVDANPFAPENGKEAHFYFCERKPTLNIEKIDSIKAESEEYAVNEKVFYLHAPDGIGRSKLVANIEVCLGVPATGRNLNTINKIQALIA